MKILLAVIFGLTAGLAQADGLYRWVDEQGKVHYTDQPPPANIKNVEKKKLGASYVESTQLPYATQMAVKNYPVTLYATDCGEPCAKAREHLEKRGVPHTAKNPQSSEADRDALKKLIGGLEVPVLLVGNASPLKGYEAGAWDAALDAAGYPKSGPMNKKKSSAPADGGAKP